MASTDTSSPDHGCLPDWNKADLPAPLPFSVRNTIKTIGPGAILLVGSIGGGEWIVGPLMTVQYGREILWIATVGIVLQTFFNLEAVRYTLYTGEPILTGIMRLWPGPRVWSAFYIILAVVQLATPALALGCANVLFAAATRRLPDAAGADASYQLWISYGVLVATTVLLLSGKSVERMLERLSWLMVIVIFGFLLLANVLFVPIEDWLKTLTGFVTPSGVPAGIDFTLLALFAATAGSGGLGNIAISNWYRDKGFGMGARMGGIGGVLARDHVELESVGVVFPVTDQSLGRWKGWWRYALIDQSLLWAMGCALGMFLNVNLAATLIPPGTEMSGYAAGAFQAQYMAEKLWQGFWILCLLNGFWVLFSTHVGNTDCLTRVVSDVCWAAHPGVQRLKASRLYAVLLLGFVAWGFVVLYLGENALSLFKVLGIAASPILAIAAIQILRVNRRFLPGPLQPSWWSVVGLLACAVFYGGIAIGLVLKMVY